MDAAVQRFQELLHPRAVLGVQQDVSSLSGKTGNPSSSVALSPEKGCGGSRRGSVEVPVGAKP